MIELPWPPSANTYYRHPTRGPLAGRHLISEKGRAYRKAVQAIQGMPAMGSARLAVTIWLYAPDRRRRDLDNSAKGLLDALTHAGVWDDDSQIDDLRIVRAEIVPGGKVLVEIKSPD